MSYMVVGSCGFTSILFLYRYSLCLFFVWFSVVKRIKYKKDSITKDKTPGKRDSVNTKQRNAAGLD